MTNQYFATFGGSQLATFNINPMKVILLSGDRTEQELRTILQQEPFNNAYCTTYPIKESKRMQEQFNMVEINLNDLLSLRS